MSEITRYGLSKDNKGLLAYFIDGNFYHVHSDEFDHLQEWTHKVLIELQRLRKLEVERWSASGQSNKILTHFSGQGENNETNT